MKNITRNQYQRLRKIVRRNIWANSLEVTAKKYQYIYGFTVMGGIVLRKKIMPRKQSYLAHSRAGIIEQFGPPSYWLDQRRIEDMRPAMDLRLAVFDFSGSFEIVMTMNHENSQWDGFFKKVRTGDAVFALGQVLFSEKTGRLRLEASWLGLEHEFINYLQTRPEEFDVEKQITEAVKKGGYYLKWDYYAGFTHPERPQIREWTLRDLAAIDPMAAVRDFYRGGYQDKDIPGFLEALSFLYWRNRVKWVPRLIVKYFKIQIQKGLGQEEVRRYGWSSDKERFFSRFPHLRRKICWPGRNIDNLRIRECAKN
ncbi:MAG: hypothetical protein BWY44_01456 [Candidatus Omnitrophica bacterium ADurb.Bin292]|nr:MAG: hypothetical protein BWY44_01456 [Candidatus Omnitrophica bacterium ADurb.Bin292]